MNYKRIPTPLAVLLSISFICLILPFPLLGSDQFLETCLRTAAKPTAAALEATVRAMRGDRP
jgi:hypothetical protein